MNPAYVYSQIPEWPRLRERYLASWRRERLDRGVIAHLQNPNRNRPEPEPWMLALSEQTYLDPEKLFALKAWRRTSWNWHADLFQYTTPFYGPNVFVGFCGAQPVFGQDTVWHQPLISSLDEADRVHFDEDNRYWRAHLESVDYFSQQCEGRLQLGTTDFGGPTDWIATVMGTEAFLMETIQRPDEMREFALRLADECNQAFDLMCPRVMARNDGVVDWMPYWSDLRMGTVQDDMAINFSPDMYREVFLPALERMARHTERTVLHWHDGAAQHLESLLAVEAIDLVQFGHDPSSPPFRESLPLMQRIQQAGKLLFISCVEAEDAEFFLTHLDPRGLALIINTADDEASRQMEDRVAEVVGREGPT